MRRRAGPMLAPLAAVAALLASCAGSTSLPSEVTAQQIAQEPGDPTVTTVVPTRECTPEEEARATATYPALDELPEPMEMPAGTKMREIQDEGRLVVGVSGDTLLFGSRNPFTTELEGFDIDILKEVAKAIFGEGGEERIEYRVITYADRLPSLEAREVDIVAHTMTITCTRWQRIAFSSVYFLSAQKMLVQEGSGYDSVADLAAAGATVCAPEGSTNIELVRSDDPRFVGMEVLGKPDISDCLVAMQQGEADATTGDDTVLAGFAAQDPNTEVLVDEALSAEPYGLGMNEDDVELVRFVNAVLEEIRANGRYDEIVQRWLVDTGALPSIEAVPEPDESRPLP